jgi:hypothetical protein
MELLSQLDGFEKLGKVRAAQQQQQQACRFLSVLLLSRRMLSPAQLTSARSTQLLTEGIARPPDPTPACLSACLLAGEAGGCHQPA